MRETVREKFKSLNCAQIIFSHFFDNNDLVAMSSMFGGGFMNASFCASYAASLGVLGLKFRDKEILNAKVAEFKNEYDKLYKSVVCAEILDADYRTKEGMAKIQKENLFGTICVDLTAECIEILEKITR